MDAKLNNMSDPYQKEELARTAQERSQLLGLLATVFRTEPSAEFILRLRSAEMRQALEAAGVSLEDAFFTQSIETLSERLAEDFTRLFLGPGHHISPHESIQLKRGSGILWGEETGVVKRFMAEAGFELDENVAAIPDHIFVELEFLSHLADQEATAIQMGEWERVRAALNWQHRFISDHLGKWIGLFAARVQEQDSGYYAAMAELASAFLSGQKSEILQRLRLINEQGV